MKALCVAIGPHRVQVRAAAERFIPSHAKFCGALAIGATIIASPLRAQVVSDGTTNTLSNVTTNFTGDVIVGTNGAFTLLVLSDNALLTNSANGVISLNPTATSNEVRLVSPSASWLMGGTLFVGSNGAFSTLVVSNGAFVRANTGRIGSRAGSGNNVVLVTGSGSTWNSVGTFVGADLLVGGGGSGNRLIVSNGGRVIGNSGGIVGNNVGTSNNLALVTGTGSIWSNASNLRVGFNGTGNRLVIEAGGSAHCDTGTVGDFGSASNNEALVTGPGSLWTNRSFLTIGSQAGRNRLVVSNGAAVWSGTGSVGGSSAFSNQVVVTGAGSVWSNQTFLSLGAGSVGNRVDVSDGGWLACNDGKIGQSFGANSNTVVLFGSGSGWNNLASLSVGEGGNGNVLIASNGATVLSSDATIGVNGSTANNNLALITGAGTLWSNRNDLVVGNSGVGNRLQVDNGATVLSGNLFIGFNSLSADNRVTVSGGTLRVTNAAGTGVLDVRRGTNVLNAGLIEADWLLVTNTSGRFVFNGGTLAVGKITIANNFTIGDGVSPATLNLTGDDTHSFPSTLLVRPNATLRGNGTILVPVFVQSGATLSPGTAPGAIGRLTASGSASLGGISIMEIGKSGSVLTNDQLQVAGPLTYLGDLIVSHLGPDPLTAGDRFQLFAAGSYAGSFVILTLPPLNPGLVWANNLLVDGSIEVIVGQPPAVQTLPATGLTQTTATLQGAANPQASDTSAWFEWGFTTDYGNLTPAQPLGSAIGNTDFSETLTALTPGISYHFRAVASNSFGFVVGGNQSFTLFSHFSPAGIVRASNLGDDDAFGHAAAVSENALAVIGAPFEDSNATGINGNQSDDTAFDAGAVYAFMRNGTNWSQQAYLKASNAGSSDNFGFALAISGETAVVGAPSEQSNATGVNGNQSDNSANSAGAAYVFARDTQGWSQQAYLKGGNTEAFDSLGTSVAIAGDTIVIGAPQEDSSATGVNGNGGDNGAPGAGAAYVFVRNGTNWSQQAYLKASNPESFDFFGATVAISGDTIVVGATGEDSGATGVNGNQSDNSVENSGAAYVFVRSGINWTQQAYVKASNPDIVDEFGTSLAISGDLIVVGATSEQSDATGINGDQSNNSLFFAGAAYVFARHGTNLSQEAYLKASDTAGSLRFGNSVAISRRTVVVGTDGHTNAYVFQRANDSWAQLDLLQSSLGGFGMSVSISKDTIVVGAPSEDFHTLPPPFPPTFTGSGAAHFFARPSIHPVLRVEEAGLQLSNGGSLEFLVASLTPFTRNFTIGNLGNAGLLLSAVTTSGPDAGVFTIEGNPASQITPGGNTDLSVSFAPTSAGLRTATLRINSNDEDNDPFDLLLTGRFLTFTEDSDSDGLNDASELLMASLGFNFQVSQTSLVNTLFNNVGGAVSNLNAAGFFTQSQLQALNVNSPLLAKDPLTSLFTLTIGVEMATHLTNFFPFPMTAPQTTINAEGKLEFQFSPPDNAAFFRLEAR